MKRSGVLPTTQFAYWKGLCTCNAPLCPSHTMQRTLVSLQEARDVQIDCNEAFDIINHHGVLYRLCSVDIGGFLVSILT